MEEKTEQSEFRGDGYTNMLNKYGTPQDNSTAYNWEAEPYVDDSELIRLYEGNGLFTKIIDRPAEEAVKHGLDIDFGDEKVSEYVEDALEDLDFEDSFATAEKWARLFGGAIIVMIVNDGRRLDEPLDFRRFTRIEELRVFERKVVQADSRNISDRHFFDSITGKEVYGEPEYYNVFSLYGNFTVHRSRCLVFRNGRAPEQTTQALYREWGIPEYVKIRKALRECITTHEYGTKMLERSVQAIYKIKNMAQMLATDEGEDKVLKRLQVIDMARGILNSIAIDSEGEDYNFITGSMSGVNEIINSTCNMLSAVTDIPQTILFGRSPSGMNATGESDLENYYNMVENIQKQNMKKNVKTLIKLIIRQGFLEDVLDEECSFKVKFASLWSPTEAEQISNEMQRVSIQKTKADIANTYMNAGVIDPTEVRATLAKEGDFELEEVIPDDELDIPDSVFDIGTAAQTLSSSLINAMKVNTEAVTDSDNESIADTLAKNVAEVVNETTKEDSEGDIINLTDSILKNMTNIDGEDTQKGVGVIVIKDGKILVGDRTDKQGICGPGGHVQDDETTEEAAYRETAEEFRITPKNIVPLGHIEAVEGCCPSAVYICTDFTEDPIADGEEMTDARWVSLEELNDEKLFPSFDYSLNLLTKVLTDTRNKYKMDTTNEDGAPKGNNNAAKDHPKAEEKKPESESKGISAKGANLSLPGFSTDNLDRHWNGGISPNGKNIHGHKDEFKGLTKEQYAQRALEMIRSAVDDEDIEGYMNTKGQIVRFNNKTGEFVKGDERGIATFYKPCWPLDPNDDFDVNMAGSYYEHLRKLEEQ